MGLMKPPSRGVSWIAHSGTANPGATPSTTASSNGPPGWLRLRVDEATLCLVQAYFSQPRLRKYSIGTTADSTISPSAKG